ncbi:hypothetical protein UlMin_006563 [Ulmus minor]
METYLMRNSNHCEVQQVVERECNCKVLKFELRTICSKYHVILPILPKVEAIQSRLIFITKGEGKSPEVCYVYVAIYILPLLHKGNTARMAPVFGLGGHAYVYLSYGLQTMLNVVVDKEGNGAAVLIRACALISGHKTDKPVLLTGPGKVRVTKFSHEKVYFM